MSSARATVLKGFCSTGSCPIRKDPCCCSSLNKAWIIFSYAGACTVWRLYCAQPLYEAQQRSNKSLSLLPFLHVTSRSPSLLQAPSSCLWKAKAFLVIDTWLATFLGRGSLSWRRALCMSHGCLSARYTCTAASSSTAPSFPPTTTPPSGSGCQQQVYSSREASPNSFRESF